jgi:hypothetical protein
VRRHSSSRGWCGRGRNVGSGRFVTPYKKKRARARQCTFQRALMALMEKELASERAVAKAISEMPVPHGVVQAEAS